MYVTDPISGVCEQVINSAYKYTYDDATKTITATNANGEVEKSKVLSITDTEIPVHAQG